MPESSALSAPSGATSGIESTTLVLVRHAQSTWNDERRIQGQMDPPLSVRGEAEAAALGQRMRDVAYDAFYSSDLRRARQTAEAIAPGARLEPRLREVALGEWEGLTRDEIVARNPEEWARWAVEPDWDIVPGGEGSEPFRSRVEAIVQDLLDRHRGETVLAVTHGGVIQAALAWTLRLSIRGRFHFAIDNTSITILARTGAGRTVVRGVNDHAHLAALRLTAPAR